MSYKEADEQVFYALSEHAKGISSSISRSKHPYTYRAFLGFVAKTGALKNGIFDAVESNNPYVQRVIFRVLCEHYLKFMHIFLRYTKEKSDAPGMDFFKYCGASELKDYGKSLKIANELIGKDASMDFGAMLEKFYPEAAKLSSRQLEEKSSEFSYREILRRIRKETPEILSDKTSFLASIVPAYAELSSFVHGGPMSDDAMLHFSSDEESKELERKASLAFLLAGNTQSLVLMAISSEFKEFTIALEKTHMAIHNYLNCHKE